jgi:hypothetical protein
MSNLTRVVPPPVIPHLRVPSSTSSAVTRERCHGLLPMMVVTLTYMPRLHTSQERGMVQCNEVIAFLSFQIASHLSLVKPLGIHDLQPQTVMVGASCLHSSLDVTSQFLVVLNTMYYYLGFIDKVRTKYDSLLAQSN